MKTIDIIIFVCSSIVISVIAILIMDFALDAELDQQDASNAAAIQTANENKGTPE